MKKKWGTSLVNVFGTDEMKEWLSAGEEVERISEALPIWIQNIWRQIEKSILKAHGLPKDTRFTLGMIGTLAGQLLASSKTTMRKAPGEKAASPAMKKLLREVRKEFKAFRPVLREAARKLTEYGDGLSLPKVGDFHANKGRAVERNIKGSGFWLTDATQTYLTLIRLRHQIESRRISSVSELHKALVAILGKNRAGDLKRTEGICRRIKLKFRPRGRPKKISASSG